MTCDSGLVIVNERLDPMSGLPGVMTARHTMDPSFTSKDIIEIGRTNTE
jgi:hypothetical protein